MLSVDEARARVLAATPPLDVETQPLTAELLGRVLAEDVISRTAVPPFDNSAMDGFALRAGPADRTLTVVDESRAGAPARQALEDGEAIRISTGAKLPAGADAVVMVEKTTDHGASVQVHEATRAGQNLRRAGEDLKAGATVLRPGTVLGPAELGVAANAGAGQLRVARRPRVAVLTTGDELVPAGTELADGQIHDSNGIALAGLVARKDCELVLLGHAPDTREQTEQAIAGALEQADVLVLTGGVSVGPHDHVKPALEAQGVQQDFWRVALRPGKPTWFGTRGRQLVFGLPGNPVSTMVTFELFVRPALAAMQGADPAQPQRTARLAHAVTPTPGREELVRVTLTADGTATPTGAQGSHVLSSMLGATGLARIAAGEDEIPAGTTVDVLLLDGS